MKRITILIISLFVGACSSNPYLDPSTSKAVSEQNQTEEMKQQTRLMQEQNKQLERIANAMDSINNKIK